MSSSLYVIVGVTGPLGAAIARALRKRGDRVRGVNRSGHGKVPSGVELVAADVKDASVARQVCAGATVIFHCASAPYTDWSNPTVPKPLRWTDEADHLPEITKGVVAGAAHAGARIVYGDNFYMYGPVDEPLTEELPWAATDRKGLARISAVQDLLDAHGKGNVGVDIGCASDFFGPEVLNSTVGDRVFDAALQGEPVEIFGAPDVLHTYSFIDDVAAGMITLADSPTAHGQVWHLPNDEPVTPRHFMKVAYEVAGNPHAIQIADDSVWQQLGYQAHLHDREYIVDHTKFATMFGAQPTALRDAIRVTIDWLREHK